MAEATALRGTEHGSSGETVADSVPARRIERRRPLPGGRAVAGGFLVAASVVGVFASYTRATATPTEAYVVAARDLRPGAVIEPADLTEVRVHLNDSLAGRAVFRDKRRLVGATLLGPVGRGEFVQATTVVRRAGESRSELSFAIEPSRAVNGAIRPGEAVDVIATYGTGPESYSVVVAAGATVVHVEGGSDSLAPSRTITVTLALAAGDAVLAVAHAIDAAKVTLVRSAPSTPSTPYRPPASG